MESNGCISKILVRMWMAAEKLCFKWKKEARHPLPADLEGPAVILPVQDLMYKGVLAKMSAPQKKTHAPLVPGGWESSSSSMRASQQTRSESDPLVVLPVDVVARIFSTLAVRTYVAATSVSRNWNLLLCSPDFALIYRSLRKDAATEPEEWLVEMCWCDGDSRTERGLHATAYDRATNTCHKLPHPRLEEVELLATSSNGKALLSLCAGAGMVKPSTSDLPRNFKFLGHSETLNLVVWDPLTGSTWGPIRVPAAHTFRCPPPCQHAGPVQVSIISFDVGEDEAHPGKVLIKELSILARQHCTKTILADFVAQTHDSCSPWAVSIQTSLDAGYAFGQHIVCGQAKWMLAMNQVGCCDLFRDECHGNGPPRWTRAIHNMGGATSRKSMELSLTMQEHGGCLFFLGYKYKNNQSGRYTRLVVFKVPVEQILSIQDATREDQTWKLSDMEIIRTPDRLIENSRVFRKKPVDWLLTTDGRWAVIRLRELPRLLVADLTSQSRAASTSWGWHDRFKRMHRLSRGHLKWYAALLAQPQLHEM